MPRYRRLKLSRNDSAATTALSIAVGVGAAAVTWYVTRLFLSRDPLEAAPPVLPDSPPRPALARGDTDIAEG